MLAVINAFSLLVISADIMMASLSLCRCRSVYLYLVLWWRQQTGGEGISLCVFRNKPVVSV